MLTCLYIPTYINLKQQILNPNFSQTIYKWTRDFMYILYLIGK